MARTIAELYASAHGITTEQAQADIRNNNATLINVVDDFLPTSPPMDISDMVDEAVETLANFRSNPPTVFTSTPSGHDAFYQRLIQDQADAAIYHEAVSLTAAGNQPLTYDHVSNAVESLNSNGRRLVKKYDSKYEFNPHNLNKGTNMTYKYRVSKSVTLDEFLMYNRINNNKDEDLIALYNSTELVYESTTLKLSSSWVDIPGYDLKVRGTYLELAETSKPEGTEWAADRNKTIRLDGNHLMDQIRTRYAFLHRPTNGLSNIVIDNYAPKLMHMTQLDAQNLQNISLPKTAYAISPWFAQYFGVQQIATEQLCRILGFSVKDIKDLITKVKRKGYSISFIGYGGTGVNTIHWLTEMLKMTQTINLFNFIEVYEPDSLEISNLLRFPKNPYVEANVYNYNQASKLRLLSAVEQRMLSKNTPYISTSTVDASSGMPYGSKAMSYSYERNAYVTRPNHIFYGAPDINTRNSFEGIGHFISATHNGNKAHLWLNPTQDTDLQVESYGLIELTPFFMNQLRLAIGLLEYLAQPDLDLTQRDTLLAEYEFDGIPKLSTNRVYNFQLNQHDGLVATEEAAAEW